jgi:NAD(P)H-hydrate repair Nnr-like enzyme with NAD(P)H-hydrate epimerase domain
MLIADATQIRIADQKMITGLGFPGYILMETAGRLAAETALLRYQHLKSAMILCGPGNNGGDGLVMARYLHLAGWELKILFSHSPAGYVGDAAIALQSLNGSGIPVACFGEANWKCPTREPCSWMPCLERA